MHQIARKLLLACIAWLIAAIPGYAISVASITVTPAGYSLAFGKTVQYRRNCYKYYDEYRHLVRRRRSGRKCDRRNNQLDRFIQAIGWRHCRPRIQ